MHRGPDAGTRRCWSVVSLSEEALRLFEEAVRDPGASATLHLHYGYMLDGLSRRRSRGRDAMCRSRHRSGEAREERQRTARKPRVDSQFPSNFSAKSSSRTIPFLQRFFLAPRPRRFASFSKLSRRTSGSSRYTKVTSRPLRPRHGRVWILALAACDVRDRGQHDGSRNRQFDWKRGQSERSSRSARCRRERPMQKLRIGPG
jgi:hypothetical protein